ncbi:hypothetical protein BO83DRAFT_39492 [Aspergillus eucalypticola CBS 122712]|uniref:Uncharacterized protein n=1 Tax=Aspergillus eucalypticola (strain CBS 122712 / IBT 29274) TaxID=1448314 RepID=A0A317VEI9_ASPEC|nr:uncharacterized protein BO83DRAFT_39492 [Aspergillus eucalypticola CBS 122712]PWY72756.1 hypothetical protein BO83DRAFT_39492 [Aspergillus eucalypticola CBS 122712]
MLNKHCDMVWPQSSSSDQDSIDINVYNPENHVVINKATVAVQQAQKGDPKGGAVCQLQRICRSKHVLRNYPDEPPKVFEPFLNSKAWWLRYCHALTARYCQFSKLWVRWATPKRPREYRPHGGVMH